MAWRAGLWPAGRLLQTPGLKCMRHFIIIQQIYEINVTTKFQKVVVLWHVLIESQQKKNIKIGSVVFKISSFEILTTTSQHSLQTLTNLQFLAYPQGKILSIWKPKLRHKNLILDQNENVTQKI